jgi:hypothetical protein
MTKLSYEELEKQISDAKKQIVPGTKWRHYKGGEYTIKDIVVLEETQSLAVIYTSNAHPTVSFARPLSVWSEQIECDGQTIDRFSRIL